jgi:hypothetical protein
MSLGEPLNPAEIRVGTRAHIWLAGVLHEVEIVEDRGAVPSTGHRIARIRLLDSDDSSLDFEVPADRLVRGSSGSVSPTDQPSKRRRGTRRIPA